MRYKYNHEKIVEVCSTALTFTEIEARLGTTTPNTTLRRYIKRNKVPMPLYEGQRAASRLSQKSRERITDADLCENSKISTGGIKRHLIRSGYKKEECEQCGWCKRRESDGKIPIHLHHKNGNSLDNRLVNLEFLCPCCHSLTNNYAGKNKKSLRRTKEASLKRLYYSVPKHTCVVCGKLGYGEIYCSNKCFHESSRKVEWPTKEQLTEEINSMSWVAIGRKYNVSDNAVRKWATYYGI